MTRRCHTHFGRHNAVSTQDQLKWWDKVKLHFKEVAIAHSIRRSRETHRQEKALENKLTNIQNMRQPDIKAIQDTKQQLEHLTTARLEGVKIRSGASWLEYGETPNAFSNLKSLNRREAFPSCRPLPVKLMQMMTFMVAHQYHNNFGVYFDL